MLKIRLQRVGRRNDPSFRIVLTESRNSPRSGKYLEVIGHHDSRRDNSTEIDAERVKYWIARGAQVSDTVYNFLVRKGIIKGKKRNVVSRKTPLVITGEGVKDATSSSEVAAASPYDGEVQAQ